MKRIPGISILIAVSMLILFNSARTIENEKLKQTNTPGQVNLTITTESEGGTYAPRHVLAFWIEDTQGNFIKTCKLNAIIRKQYLYTWKAASNYNVVDAITGATLNAHTTHVASWDCTDVNGQVVWDGLYTIHVEYTEKHAQGPLTSYTFFKGVGSIDTTFADEAYFKNIHLQYGNNIGYYEWKPKQLMVYPNPAKSFIYIDLPNIPDTNPAVTFYSADGKKIITTTTKQNTGKIRLETGRIVKPGLYYLYIITEDNNYYAKISLVK